MQTLSHKRPLKFVAAAVLGISSLVAGVGAQAGTATSNLSATASVTANCTISTAAVAFGAYDPVSANASAALDGTGTVTVTCTSGASTTVTLGQGSNADTGSTDAAPVRRMKNGTTDYLSYEVFQETGRTTVWGNTAGTGVAHIGTGTATPLTVFGRVAAGQNVPAGSYSDTVVATVTF